MTATRIDRGSTNTTAIYSDAADLVFERTFDAPREKMWKAFTDPNLVPRWWGKHGTTTIVEAMDVRPGGKWRYINRAPDRDDVVFYGEYLEVIPNERLVFTEVFGGMPEAGAVTTLTFTEKGGRTTLTTLVQHQKKEHRDAHINSGMEAGMQDAMDLLEQVAISLR